MTNYLRTGLLVPIALVLLLGVSANAAAQQGSDNAEWCVGTTMAPHCPTSTTGGFLQGGSTTVSITLRAPESLNASGIAALAQGIVVNLSGRLESTPCEHRDTSPCIPGDAESLVEQASAPGVTVLPSNWPFTSLGEEHVFQVTLSDASSAVPGVYDYKIKSFGDENDLQRFGWGLGSGISVRLTVSAPASCDTPVITITAPASNSSILFCAAKNEQLPYAFSASSNNQVASVSAWIDALTPVTPSTDVPLPAPSVTATGTISANLSFGLHTFHAGATNLCGNVAAETRSFDVLYVVTALAPLSGANYNPKGGSTAPLKFSVTDCDGSFVSDTSVSVLIKEGLNTIGQFYYGSGDGYVKIDPSGSDPHYLLNFKTASGVHTYTVEVYFGPVKNQTFTFTTKP